MTPVFPCEDWRMAVELEKAMVMLYPMSLLVRIRTEVVPAELPPARPASEGDIAMFEADTTKEISAVTDCVILNVLTIAWPIFGSDIKKIENNSIDAIMLAPNELKIV